MEKKIHEDEINYHSLENKNRILENEIEELKEKKIINYNEFGNEIQFQILKNTISNLKDSLKNKELENINLKNEIALNNQNFIEKMKKFDNSFCSMVNYLIK